MNKNIVLRKFHFYFYFVRFPIFYSNLLILVVVVDKICKCIKLSCVLMYRTVFTYKHLNNCLKDTFSVLFVYNYIVFSNGINNMKWKIASLTSAFYARSRLNLM